jgi:hypothetical protein
MKIYLDIALLIGLAAWAVLEYYAKTEFGLLNALVLLGLIVRFAALPAWETASKEKCE